MSANARETRTARLAEAATGRTADATARARRAITKLRHTRQPITFVSVARTASVSTSFLYQHPELRREVSEHRSSETDVANKHNASSATAESLRTKLQVALQHNSRLAEEVAVLRAENQLLRSRVLQLDHRGASSPAAGSKSPPLDV